MAMGLPDPAKSRVLLIGMPDYAELDPLPAVENNIRRLRELLTDSDLWGLPESNCITIVGDDDPRTIPRAIRAAAVSAEDLLLVYYAGHGLLPPDTEKFCLALPSSSKDHTDSALRYDDVRAAFNRVKPGTGRAVILDCCFAARASEAGMAPPPSFGDLARIPRTCMLTACDETSRALAPPGETYTAFTGELISAIGNGLDGAPELLDFDTLYRHLCAALAAKSRPQPQFFSRGEGHEFCLVRNRRYLPPSDGAFPQSAAIGRLPDATATGRAEIYRAAVAGQPVRLAPRPVFLVGREDLLAELDGRLRGSDEDRRPRTCALYGLGGAGKTSVALEHAHRHLAEVGVVWQVAAENPTVLAAGFGELAAQLGARNAHDTRDPVASVHGILAVFPAEWLLVFDNAADRASVAVFLPPAGRGRILITSQNPYWPPGEALEVPVLGTEVAADFLIERTLDQDLQIARDLAVELGGLPLALEQAAAYMQAAGDSLTEYLVLFRERRADMLGRGEPTGYSKTVATTWMLAFERLERTAPGAVGLLRLLACCAPEAIPLRLLLKPRPGLAERLGQEVVQLLPPLLEDSLAVKDAIAALRRYSLVSAPADGLVSVHRLVQAVTLDQMARELAAEWQQAAAAVVEAAIPDDPDQPESWRAFAALLPHAQVALTADTRGMQRIARYLGFSGSYVAARDLQQKIAGARQSVLGPEHPDTLSARADLARWTGAAGNWAAARDRYAALLPVAERVLGPEHPDTLYFRGNLAYWTGQAGDPAAARDLFAVLLSAADQVLGPEHPDTLSGRVYLARWTGEAGNPVSARDLFAALLPVRERVLGPEHPDTLNVRSNLAHWTGQAGDAATARDLFAALLPVAERVLGAGHPETLHNRGNLARWTGQAGDPAAARDLFAALLPVRERVGGPEHPDTLPTRGDFARWTGEAGNPAFARDLLAALLPVAERVLGAEHPETLRVRHELARWTGQAGDPASARDLLAALLPVAERVLGPEHPETLRVRHELARWTGQAGSTN
jgi:hypothetical protein